MVNSFCMKRLRICLSFIFSGFCCAIIGTAFYMASSYIPSLKQQYSNADIFFQNINPRDFLYGLEPFILSLVLLTMFLFFKNCYFFKKKLTNILSISLFFGLLFSLLILPVFILLFAMIKISLNVILYWLLQRFCQAFICGMIYSKSIKY